MDKHQQCYIALVNRKKSKKYDPRAESEPSAVVTVSAQYVIFLKQRGEPDWGATVSSQLRNWFGKIYRQIKCYSPPAESHLIEHPIDFDQIQTTTWPPSILCVSCVRELVAHQKLVTMQSQFIDSIPLMVTLFNDTVEICKKQTWKCSANIKMLKQYICR